MVAAPIQDPYRAFANRAPSQLFLTRICLISPGDPDKPDIRLYCLNHDEKEFRTMTTTATATIVRPAGKGNGILAAMLRITINVLGAAVVRQPAAGTATIVEAPRSHEVDLWKLYWTAATSGASSPKVRRMLQRAGR